MTTKITMENIVNLAKNRGFVYAGSEIYGGLANTWDYGPYGSQMKENLKNLWLKEFVQKRTDMVSIDAGILMNPQVWVASGHVGGFSDPLIDDKNTGERFRADKLLEDLIEKKLASYVKTLKDTRKGNTVHGTIEDSELHRDIQRVNKVLKRDINLGPQIIVGEKDIDMASQKHLKELFSALYSLSGFIPEAWSLEKQTEVMRGEGVINPTTEKTGDWTNAKKFNLMFQTSQGVTADSSSVIYMRPETAQGIFVNFANIARTSRKRIPFGVAQVGKAFRNEITPGNFIFRTREFEQMEIEYFCEPEKSIESHTEWKELCYDFLIQKIGIKEESLKKRDHDADELSHYSSATTDIEFKFPFGWGELWGIAHRGDFDLKAHMTESKQDLSYFDPVNNKKYIPHVIEPSVGLTRLFLATLTDAYTVEEERTYLKFNPKVAPIKVGVLPVVKKLSEEGKQVYAQLSEEFICEYDETGSVGKRYARMDEIGTPFCVTIDSENFDAGNVTVRHRDSMEQEVVSLAELNDYIRERLR